MKDCDKWRDEPLINPRTNRHISPTGKVFKDLVKECGPPKGTPKGYAPMRHKSPPIQQPQKGLPKGYAPLCTEWLKHPNLNPRTGRTIKTGGPIYKEFEKECGSPTAGRKGVQKQGQDEPSDDECYKWLNERERNPRTGRIISPNGKIYKWFKDNCDKSQGTQGSPDTSAYGSLSVPHDDDEPWLAGRIETGRRIIQNLKAITTDQWDMCMTGTSGPLFKQYFSDIHVIGRGTFGQIFKASLKGDEVVIKEAYLRPKEKRVLKQVVTSDVKWDDIPKNTYPEEYRYMNMVNDLLLSEKCPNFLYTYNMAVCDGCKVKGAFKDIKKPTSSCYISFMEPADSDMASVVLATVNEQRSVFYQLLLAVHAIHQKYAIFHRDIKTHNVLIQRIKPGGHFEYIIGNKSFYIENTGIVAFLADFGVASCYSPIYGTGGSYGFRNAEVMTGDVSVSGSNLYFSPFKSQQDYEVKMKQVTIVPPYLVDWKDDQTGQTIESTMNQFNKYVNIMPNRMVNINDNSKFPPFEFFNDIQDVVRMFIGGKQTVQPGDHHAMYNLDPVFKDQLTTQAYLAKDDDVYHIHGTVKYILAEEMLDQLYIETPMTHVIETFFMS